MRTTPQLTVAVGSQHTVSTSSPTLTKCMDKPPDNSIATMLHEYIKLRVQSHKSARTRSKIDGIESA